MIKHPKIFLCGFMGCGKTTHGKKLAKLLGYQFIDLDDYISKKHNTTIQNLFDLQGEDKFRQIESQLLEECMNSMAPTVVSLGGGTPCFNNNADRIKANGLLVYIKMDAAALFNRLQQSKTKRPLLKGKTDEELRAYIDRLLADREDCYNRSHFWVSGINLTDAILRDSIENFQE